jgi:hypothetical protein
LKEKKSKKGGDKNLEEKNLKKKVEKSESGDRIQ